MERIYGLIGKDILHSFSKEYFSRKFSKERIQNCYYKLFSLAKISDFTFLIKTNHFSGLNVTIPYKKALIPYLDRSDKLASRIGAINVIKFEKKSVLVGYNSDYYGFKISLERFIGKKRKFNALVLGTGGSAKAVSTVLNDMNIAHSFVSRTSKNQALNYKQLKKEILHDHLLIINCTPLGMFPYSHQYPPILYEHCTEKHYLHDLIYNPEETLFMKKGKEYGAKVKNGIEMLKLQAEKSWEIWNMNK